MTEAELKEKIIIAALEWRDADESEPIPSDIPGQKLSELAFAIDDYQVAIGTKTHSKKV